MRNVEFKVGDMVEVINEDRDNHLYHGHIYQIDEIIELDTVLYLKIKGIRAEFFLSRFKLVKPAEVTSIGIINKKSLTLSTDSDARKQIPLLSGCVNYFPAALAGVAKISKIGNDKHNLGQELHHDRTKSLDHADCILRHMLDLQDLIAALNRCETQSSDSILAEASSLAWRALAYSQALHEKYDGAPLAPGAKNG